MLQKLCVISGSVWRKESSDDLSSPLSDRGGGSGSDVKKSDGSEEEFGGVLEKEFAGRLVIVTPGRSELNFE